MNVEATVCQNLEILTDPLTAYHLPTGLKLNLGCGPVQPAEWVNIDGSNRARLAVRAPWLDRLLTGIGLIPPTEFSPRVKIQNLFKPLPYDANSISAVYAGEVWEHFELPDATKLTAECLRVLAPGGVLRVCVPDGVEFWSNYLRIFKETMAMPRHERTAKRLRDHTAMFFREICTRKRVLGSMGHTHKWQFDEVQLIELFEHCGFVDVARMEYHRSRVPDITVVERSNYLIVEGVKPR